eukprot:CAMPEP_0117853152 /NCGR_PEP_ID=MMETSP0949-20121206/23523_1 /TAXON_ID=44440 /ORGANISM="Chattonella subsalsa, Strain CCMP2191" /LENGTH=172 /DNA_ID=CAMNT_0005701503 /DNA_START=86 /DNA_END=604 /DNA_ORIENTATION=+
MKTPMPADFEGWFYLENFMLEQVAYFKDLPCFMMGSSPRMKPPILVIMSNHWICDDKHNGRYREIHDKNEHSPACIQWFSDEISNRKDFQQIFSGKGQDYLVRTCSQAMFSANGSKNLANRMTKWASEHHVSLVNGFESTFGQCNQTWDGVHYSPTIVRSEIMSLVKVLSEA